jgi:hypothetical protein
MLPDLAICSLLAHHLERRYNGPRSLILNSDVLSPADFACQSLPIPIQLRRQTNTLAGKCCFLRRRRPRELPLPLVSPL